MQECNPVSQQKKPQQWSKTSNLPSYTYPSSVNPFINSSRVNSHCVAARNFQAKIRTRRESGGRSRSSSSRITPSTRILFGSLPSRKKHRKKNIELHESISGNFWVADGVAYILVIKHCAFTSKEMSRYDCLVSAYVNSYIFCSFSWCKHLHYCSSKIWTKFKQPCLHITANKFMMKIMKTLCLHASIPWYCKKIIPENTHENRMYDNWSTESMGKKYIGVLTQK